jgi:hypothetical protein
MKRLKFNVGPNPSTGSRKSGARESSRTRSPPCSRRLAAPLQASPAIRTKVAWPSIRAGPLSHPTSYHRRPISRLVAVAGQHRLADHYRSSHHGSKRASRRHQPNRAYSPPPPSSQQPRRLRARWAGSSLTKRTWRRGTVVSRQQCS